MITQQLLDYIAQKSSAGVSETDIRNSLINNGWAAADLDAAFAGRVTNSPEMTPAAVSTPLSQFDAITKVKQMGKFKASWMLFKQSVNLLQKDKEVLMFPIVSSVVSLIVFTLFAGVLWMSGMIDSGDAESEEPLSMAFYGVTFLYYVITYFVLTFFRVGLTAVVYERINGGDIGFGEGLQRAKNIAGKIFVWSVFSGTVGIILRIISDRSEWLGKLVAALLGAAWGIVTFFIAPTLLLDGVSVWQSIKNSGNVFRKTWGETLITNISLGLISFLIHVAIIIGFGGLFLLALSAGGGMIAFVVILGLLFITLFIASLVLTSLSEIFKVALYSYARFGIIAEGFSPEFIVGAIKENTKKE